jgi:hypothetical protein
MALSGVRPFFFLTLALAASPLQGCKVVTMGDVMEARKAGDGTIVTYAIDLGQAWEIARTVLEWEVGEHIDSHRDMGYMLVYAETNELHADTFIGVWLDDASVGHTKVTAITRRMQPLAPTRLTERTFHRRFAQALAIVESGRPLPKDAPPFGR